MMSWIAWQRRAWQFLSDRYISEYLEDNVTFFWHIYLLQKVAVHY